MRCGAQPRVAAERLPDRGARGVAALRRARRRGRAGARHPVSAGRVDLRLHRCPLRGVGRGLCAGAVGRGGRSAAAPAPAGPHARARDPGRARRRRTRRRRRRLGAAPEPGGGRDQRPQPRGRRIAPARGNDSRGDRRAHVRGRLRPRRARAARGHRAGDRGRRRARGAGLDRRLVPGADQLRARPGRAGAGQPATAS